MVLWRKSTGEGRRATDEFYLQRSKDLERCTWDILAKGDTNGDSTHSGAAIVYPIELRFPFNGGEALVK